MFLHIPEHEAWPVMHKPVEWEEIKAFFKQEQKLLLQDIL